MQCRAHHPTTQRNPDRPAEHERAMRQILDVLEPMTFELTDVDLGAISIGGALVDGVP
jgi:hypothetical protein